MLAVFGVLGVYLRKREEIALGTLQLGDIVVSK